MQAIAKMKPPGEHPKEGIDCRYMIPTCISCSYLGVQAPFASSSYTFRFASLYMLISEQALEDGVNSDLYICGMQPLEEGKPCHEIFQCDPGLECSTPMYADFYNISRPFMASSDFIRDPLLCSICAVTSHDAVGGQIHVDLKTVYTNVLPICDTCKRKGAIIVVGRYVPDGQAILKRLDYDRRTLVMQRARTA
jgi:hypothetical protein